MTTTSGESGNEPIRSFLYVDAYKLNSISAQVFSGLTNAFVQEAREGTSESETQKGVFASGRALGDATFRESTRQEHRVVHDFAYTRLEQELLKRGKVLEVAVGDSPAVLDLREQAFIKVTGRTTFLDLQAISAFMTEFNKFGEAITYMTTLQARQEASSKLREQLASPADRNLKARLKAQLKSLESAAELAKAQGLHFDAKGLEAMAYLLARGFGDHFELQIRPQALPAAPFFSSLLKREYLRESEGIIVKKYGREAQSSFTLVGVVAQCGKTDRVLIEQDPEASHLRDAIRTMALHMCNVEDGFFGAFENEVVVDPIAVYRTL